MYYKLSIQELELFILNIEKFKILIEIKFSVYYFEKKQFIK